MSSTPFKPLAVCEIDVAEAAADHVVTVSARYARARVLVRWHTHPLGLVDADVRNGVVDLVPVRTALSGNFAPLLVRALADERYELGPRWYRGEFLTTPSPAAPIARESDPALTVAICTRKRPDDLRTALLAATSTVGVDRVLVVDNDADGSAGPVAAEFPMVDYVIEPRPGLDRARNRALAECTTELLGFCDDDARLDPHWAGQVRRVFGDDPEAAAVTGLVLPAQLDHEAQDLFERTGGFRRGFERKRGVAQLTPTGWRSNGMLGIGDYGVGTNMTFRCSVFDRVGRFDEALDAGTIVGGAGDLDMLFRVAMDGNAIVYEPSAIIWHRHRETSRALGRQLSYNGGVIAFLQGVLERYPDERDSVRWVYRWIVRYHVKNLIAGPIPRRYAIVEAYGYLRCWLGRHRARSIADTSS